MKRFLKFFIFIFIIIFCVFLWQVWNNNQHTETITKTQINQHLNKSVAWLESNYSSVEHIKNPILWWMIKQAAENTGNKTLHRIFKTYKQNHLDTQANNLSTPMFNKLYRPRIPDISAFENIHDYQLFFFYGLSCDKDLGSEPVIQAQLRPGFCSVHYLRPRCMTHQLMGLRFMQRYQCGSEEIVRSTITGLQSDIVSELTWDFRVGDAYIQRVTMLVDSGAYKTIKPFWIKQILSAQNEDGSWDDLDPVLHLSDNKVIAFTSRLPTIAEIKPDFHATAQAIWLLSMLSIEADMTD